MERELWDPVAHFPLHLWREVAPCDLVMKGCEHTAHCQTNCSTVIEILILLSPSISVTADILHTCSYFETERARERDNMGRCALWTAGSVTECCWGEGYLRHKHLIHSYFLAVCLIFSCLEVCVEGFRSIQAVKEGGQG